MRASEKIQSRLETAPLEGVLPQSPASAQAHEQRVNDQAQGVTRQLESTGEGLRVAIAQLKTLPTRLEDNFRKIVQAIDNAHEAGVELLVFPELTIPGYLSHDNLNDPEFVAQNIDVLRRVIEHSRGRSTAIVVGFVDMEHADNGQGKTRFFNSAAVIRDGSLLNVIDKTLLPDYDIFWENRYFTSAAERGIVELDGRKIGIEICEDLWDKDYGTKVTQELIDRGAELLVNISASPFQTEKYRTRTELVQGAAQRAHVPFIYANLVGVQDGYEGEVVFDGRSMICLPDGKLAGLGKSFGEDLLIADLQKPQEVLLPDWTPVEEMYDALVLGIREYCSRCGFKKVYIGLSGGIDSAVTAALAVKALGKENVIGVTMPSHITSDETKLDALLLAKNLGIRCDIRPIGPMYKAWESEAVKHHSTIAGLTKQNIQARMRGQILMEYTNEDRSAMVLNTGNKTEMALGYMTLYGDMCGGLAALADVNKLMVYELAAHHNKLQGQEEIPVTTITRVPTAELEEGQTDRANLPADYPVLSPLVDALVDHSVPIAELRQKYTPDVVDRTLRMINHNEYKRRQAPPGIRVTSKAFGAGRRLPIDNKFIPAGSDT